MRSRNSVKLLVMADDFRNFWWFWHPILLSHLACETWMFWIRWLFLFNIEMPGEDWYHCFFSGWLAFDRLSLLSRKEPTYWNMGVEGSPNSVHLGYPMWDYFHSLASYFWSPLCLSHFTCKDCSWFLQDESVLIWFSAKEEKHLRLSHVSRIMPGQRTVS